MRRRKQLAATVVFAEQPHGPYDYGVPASLAAKLKPGQRVQVPLGRGNRPMVGYCTAIANKTDRPAAPQAAGPLDRRSAAALGRHAPAGPLDGDYYLCPLGQVLQAIVPAGVRGKAGTREMTFLSVPPQVLEQLQAGKLKLGEKQLDALRILAASPRPLTPPELAQAAKCTLGPIGELRKKKLVKAEVRRIQQMEVEESRHAARGASAAQSRSASGARLHSRRAPRPAA